MKILVLRFSSIGDIVLCSPVVRLLKTAQADTIVHFATKANYAALLNNSPYIDAVKLLENNEAAFIQSLKAENYDLIIDLHHNLRTLKIKWTLGVKAYSFNKLNWAKWLMVNFKINRLPQQHIVDRYIATLKPLGIVNDGKGLDFFIPEQTDISQLHLPNQYTVYALGGQHGTKQLPLNKQIEWLNKHPEPIVLIGGKEDLAAAEALNNACSTSKTIVNVCGQVNLMQSAKIIAMADLVLSHDTGMMHIAAALKKPIHSVWGNTIPAFGMTPYYPEGSEIHQKQFEVANLACRPCSKIGFAACPKKHFNCMNMQTFE
jgi:heptosyltransferase-2